MLNYIIIFKECFRTARLIRFKVFSFVTSFPNTEVPGWGIIKSDQLITLATSLATDVEEFRSDMRAPKQTPHYSSDVQDASHPSSHSFTMHAVFNTYSPLHYDGDGGDIPFSPTKEDGDIPGMDVDGMEKNSCGKVDTTLIYK